MSGSTILDSSTRCGWCGLEVAEGLEQCPRCQHSLRSRSVRLPMTLVVIAIFVVFAFTQYFVRLHRRTEADLAQRWFQRGLQAMKDNNPAWAADGFRTALSYDRDNPEYRLLLAEALLESNHLNEARSHLTSLWEQEPADGEVNLALAHLYARRNNPVEAVRYYRNAINGVWKYSPVDQREAARFDLVNFLIGRHDIGQAQAELMALKADAPREVSEQLRLANLFLSVGEPSQAIDVYNSILAVQHENVPALIGLGKALLEVGRYRPAERALDSAVEHDPASTEARHQLELTREVLRVATGLPGLSFSERAHRVAQAYDAAWRRLTTCAASRGYNLAATGAAAAVKLDSNVTSSSRNNTATVVNQMPVPHDLQLLYTSGLQMLGEASDRSLRNNPDSLEPVMQYVFQVERATQPLCPDTNPTDDALLLLAQHENESLK